MFQFRFKCYVQAQVPYTTTYALHTICAVPDEFPSLPGGSNSSHPRSCVLGVDFPHRCPTSTIMLHPLAPLTGVNGRRLIKLKAQGPFSMSPNLCIYIQSCNCRHGLSLSALIHPCVLQLWSPLASCSLRPLPGIQAVRFPDDSRTFAHQLVIPGHEIVATIAQMHLRPSVYPTICSILNLTESNDKHAPCHLASIAAWADGVRRDMPWSAPLHYVGAIDDYPSEVCAFPGEHGWDGKTGVNVLAAIRNTTGILENWTGTSHSGTRMNTFANDDAANEALKFLIHFLGDMHMPLHLTGRDRGGNAIKVRWGGELTSRSPSSLSLFALTESIHGYLQTYTSFGIICSSPKPSVKLLASTLSLFPRVEWSPHCAEASTTRTSAVSWWKVFLTGGSTIFLVGHLAHQRLSSPTRSGKKC